jgi:hypothetical protein
MLGLGRPHAIERKATGSVMKASRRLESRGRGINRSLAELIPRDWSGFAEHVLFEPGRST